MNSHKAGVVTGAGLGLYLILGKLRIVRNQTYHISLWLCMFWEHTLNIVKTPDKHRCASAKGKTTGYEISTTETQHVDLSKEEKGNYRLERVCLFVTLSFRHISVQKWVFCAKFCDGWPWSTFQAHIRELGKSCCLFASISRYAVSYLQLFTTNLSVLYNGIPDCTSLFLYLTHFGLSRLGCLLHQPWHYH